MLKNRKQRRMISVIYLCTCLIGLGIGREDGHAQTKQGEELISPNKTLSTKHKFLIVSKNLNKNHVGISKNQNTDGCHENPNEIQLFRPKNHGQTGTDVHQKYHVDNITVIDLDLASVINSQWSGMIRAVKDGNDDQALRFISTNQRDAVRKDWTILHKYLRNLAGKFPERFHVTAIEENQIFAQAMQPSSQASLQCSLEFNFALDSDGQWRLRYN